MQCDPTRLCGCISFYSFASHRTVVVQSISNMYVSDASWVRLKLIHVRFRCARQRRRQWAHVLFRERESLFFYHRIECPKINRAQVFILVWRGTRGLFQYKSRSRLKFKLLSNKFGYFHNDPGFQS